MLSFVILHYLARQVENEKPAPLVILCHGLGSQKDQGLEPFGSKLATHGYASLIIDYRSFGGSVDHSQPAQPRQYINPWSHLEDIEAAVKFAANGSLGSTFDAKNIVLWGSSFGGVYFSTDK